MHRLIQHQNSIIVYDKSDKEFRAKYGMMGEVLTYVKDQSNLTSVITKTKNQYKIDSVIMDCHIKKKFGWKYWSDDMKAHHRKLWSELKTGVPKSEYQRRRISEGKKGKRGNHSGHLHTNTTKNIISLRAMGHKRNVGMKWCYDPYTGRERRGKELIPGYIWGRNPENVNGFIYGK